MKRSTSWSVVFCAAVLIIGFLAASGAGKATRIISAATAEPTQAEATPAATQSSGQNANAFIQAPLPTSGAIGITLGGAEGPVRLQSVLENSPAEKAGLEAGDEVVAVNGQPVKDRDGLIAVITSSKEGDV